MRYFLGSFGVGTGEEGGLKTREGERGFGY